MAVDTSTNRELQVEYIQRKFVEMLKPATVFFDYTTKGDVPENAGDYIRWLHFPRITVDTSALSQTTATDNETSSYTATATSGQLNNYGTWMKISELQARTMAPGSLDAMARALAEFGGETIDSLLLTAAKTSTKYFKAGEVGTNTGTLAAADTLKAVDFTYLASYFRTNGVPGFPQEGGQWLAALAPTQIAQLQAEATTSSGVPTWSELNKYVQGANGQNKVATGDAGSLNGFAIKPCPLAETKIAAVDTGISGYCGIAMGLDGLGAAGVGDMNPQIKIKKPGPNSTDQPLDTYWTAGVKFKMAYALLDVTRVVKVYSYAT